MALSDCGVLTLELEIFKCAQLQVSCLQASKSGNIVLAHIFVEINFRPSNFQWH